MKIILPSFAIGILSAATLLGQTESAPKGQSRGEETPAVTLGVPTASSVEPMTPSTAESAPRSSGSPQGADLLVQRAADSLAKLSSISARIRFHSDMFGFRSIGQGGYLQSGIGEQRKVRWELKTSLAEQICLWQQVSDGRYLWELIELSPEERTLNRVDLRAVRQAIEQAGERKEKSLSFKAEMSIGGLPNVAEGLRRSFQFDRAQAGQLDQLPVWIATGTWRPKALVSISKELAEQAAAGRPLDLKRLPPQLPEEVRLYLGQDDLFPYRIEYRRRGAGQGKVGQGGSDEMQTMVLVELYEVQINAPLDPRQFEYGPATGYADTTEGFLKTLGVK